MQKGDNMLRVIDKQTNTFIRDDFTFNEETEVGLDVRPSQGLYIPKWNGTEWIEGATQEYIDSLKAQVVSEPTLEDKVAEQELVIQDLTQLLVDKGVIY